MVLRLANNDQSSAGPILTTWDLRAAFDSAFPWASDTDTGAGSGGDAGGAGSGTGGDSGTGAGSGDDQSGDAGAGSDDNGGTDVKDPEKKRLSDEAAEWRRKLREQETSNQQLAERLRAFEDKDKSELEKAVRDANEFKAKAEKAEAMLGELTIKMAFYDTGAAALFKNAATGLRLIDLDGITVGEDGSVDGKAIKAKAEALLKEQPYLAADGDGSGSAGAGSGEASGRANNGKKDSSKVDYEALAKKFPALRR